MNFYMNRMGETWEKVGRKTGEECFSNAGESASGKDFRVNFKENFRVTGNMRDKGALDMLAKLEGAG